MLVRLDQIARCVVNAIEVAPRAKVATVERGTDSKISGLVLDSVIE